jgi:hypothetical protein
MALRKRITRDSALPPRVSTARRSGALRGFARRCRQGAGKCCSSGGHPAGIPIPR